MLHSKHILVLIPFVLAIFNSPAQPKTNIPNTDKFRAVHWGLDEGLSDGTSMNMLKDVNGFLWIATAFGLNRFDGSSFKKYIADKTKKNKTIIGNDIMGLKEDSLHNIWIGTNNGLYRYDIKADTFTRSLPAAPLCATGNELFCFEFNGSVKYFV